MGLVRDLLIDINRPQAEAKAKVRRAIDHNRVGFWGLHDQPDMEVPSVPQCALPNVHSLVNHFVMPLTVSLRAPLWAHVCRKGTAARKRCFVRLVGVNSCSPRRQQEPEG